MIFLAFAEGSIQLVPDGTIFIHIALILIMIWILNRTLFKPINRILEARDQLINGKSVEAQKITREAEEKSTRYEQSLRESRAESYRAVEETRTRALSLRQQEIDSVKEEVTNKVATEKASLEKQVSQAKTQLESNAQTMAQKIISNILRRPIS